MNSEPRPAPRLTTGRDVELSLDAQGRLVLATPDGSRHVGVEPVRAFPLSEPRRWVSICDPEGRELLCLESLDALPEASRTLLEEELSLREFVPVIQRIVRVIGDSTPSDWDVETDRGPTRFTLDTEDDFRTLGPHRVLISDSRKLRFHIPDTRALDASSRRILDRYL